MRTFCLYWLDGTTDIVKGIDPANAMTTAGYGHGALAALDFYKEVEEGYDVAKDNQYVYDIKEHTWKRRMW